MDATTAALFGARPGEMNLNAVRIRAEELRRTIDALLAILQLNPAALQWCAAAAAPHRRQLPPRPSPRLGKLPRSHNLTLPPPPLAHRPDAVDRFAVINVQLGALRGALRPALAHWAARPAAVNAANAPALPLMLASRPLPESEAEDAAALAALAGESDAAVAAAAAALDAAAARPAAPGGALDPRGAARTALAAAARGPASAAPAAVAPVAPGAAGARAAAARAPAPAAQAAPLEGRALLLAAASYGYGL
jgi:hypothetical protein